LPGGMVLYPWVPPALASIFSLVDVPQVGSPSRSPPSGPSVLSSRRGKTCFFPPFRPPSLSCGLGCLRVRPRSVRFFFFSSPPVRAMRSAAAAVFRLSVRRDPMRWLTSPWSSLLIYFFVFFGAWSVHKSNGPPNRRPHPLFSGPTAWPLSECSDPGPELFFLPAFTFFSPSLLIWPLCCHFFSRAQGRPRIVCFFGSKPGSALCFPRFLRNP